jgi:uncharacterized protein YukE
MKSFKRIVAGVALIAVLALPFLIYFNAQALTDWWQLRGYNPPAAVSSLASDDTMTPKARHIFYVNHPDIESNVSKFRQNCGQTEKTIILGCYHSNQDGIFVYGVKDPRLAGVQQVTAAHEMLHAAYDRLSSKDKSYVDGLLQDYYAHGLKDQRIIDTINDYKQSEPADVVNEMHSIFGTEVANLPAALENYYTRYFSDRRAVTDFAAAYEGEFNSREAAIKADDAQLSQLKNQIDSEEQTLQDTLTQINSDRARLDSERGSGQIDKYNSDVPGFNREVNQYNSGVLQLRSDIADYNSLVDKRNAIASELASLDKAIDTRLVPQATQ